VCVQLYTCLQDVSNTCIPHNSSSTVCICLCRGAGNAALFRILVSTALTTLAPEDQAEVVSAEMNANSWRCYVHSYPADTTAGWATLPGFLGLLQLAFFTAAFSQSALAGVMSQEARNLWENGVTSKRYEAVSNAARTCILRCQQTLGGTMPVLSLPLIHTDMPLPRVGRRFCCCPADRTCGFCRHRMHALQPR
jgi:hypothetical protein